MISVIIPAKNAETFIKPCLEALRNQTTANTEYEIIVVDNGSADRTAEIARDAGVCVIIEKKPGAAAARNAGIKSAAGDLICFTDSDCVPSKDWIAQMTIPFSDSEVVGCKGTYRTRQNEIVARFVQLEYEDKYDRLMRQDSIDFVDTYSAAYRREVLQSIGGFDESIKYVEDQELSFRVANQGGKLVFQPTAVVDHLHSNNLWNYCRKKFMIAAWKSKILRHHMGKAISDSHTPQVMKVQMVLIFLTALAVIGLVFTKTALIALALLLITFLVTTLPFVRKAWSKDNTVALFSPALLFVRALSQSAGFIWGTIFR